MSAENFPLTSLTMNELDQISFMVYRLEFDQLEKPKRRAKIIELALLDNNGASLEFATEYAERIARALEGKPQ